MLVVKGERRNTRGASCRGWWLWLSAIVAGVEASLERDAAMISKVRVTLERCGKEQLPVREMSNGRRKAGLFTRLMTKMTPPEHYQC